MPEHPQTLLEKGEPSDQKEALIAHLSELRRRVLLILAFFGVFFILGWNIAEPTFRFLAYPLQVAATNAAIDLGSTQLNHLDLTEPFFVLLKTAFFVALFLTTPVVFFHVYRFVAPGLYLHEKRALLPFMVLSVAFFLIGALFCFFLVMPMGFEFLLRFSEKLSNPELQMVKYLDLTTKFVLVFGLIFELPVVIMFLSRIGLVTHRHLIQYARYAIVGAFILSAILTPPDVVTQLMMAFPLIALYTLSIGVAWYFTKRRNQQVVEESLE